MYPTAMARMLASQDGLHPTEATSTAKKAKQNVENLKSQELILRLADFQQLALINDLEECLTVYHGFKLTKAQETALEKIHKMTQAWAKSLGVHQMVENIIKPTNVNLSRGTHAGEKLLDRLVGVTDSGNGQHSARGFNVQLTH